MKSGRLFILAIGVASMMGCKDDLADYTLVPVNLVYNVPSQVNGKVDILFVNDSSGSMSSRQSNLINNFSVMINKLNSRSLNYQIGVTTTDRWNIQGAFVSNTAYHATWNSIQRNDCDTVMNVGAPKILNSTMDNMIERYNCNGAVGIAGSGLEAGIASFMMALNEPMISTTNAGFVRPDAFLAIVILSDEDDFHSNDYSDATVTTFLNSLKAPTDPTDVNKYYSISAFVNTGAPNCGGFTSVGSRYISLANSTGGKIASICGDFAEAVSEISDGIARATSEVRLDREPIESTIQIIRNTIIVPKSTTNGWSYNSARQSVQFSGDYVLRSGDQLIINYDPTGAVVNN